MSCIGHGLKFFRHNCWSSIVNCSTFSTVASCTFEAGPTCCPGPQRPEPQLLYNGNCQVHCILGNLQFTDIRAHLLLPSELHPYRICLITMIDSETSESNAYQNSLQNIRYRETGQKICIVLPCLHHVYAVYMWLPQS